jgi:hypothetical protein
MLQNIRTKQAEEKCSLQPYYFLAGSRKTSSRLSFRKLDIKSNAKQSLTPAVGKSDSLNIAFKN